MTPLNYILLALELVTVAWGVSEALFNHDFKTRAEEWLKSVQGISNACSGLKGDCEKGIVESVQAAAGRVDTMGTAVYSLFTGIEDALEKRTPLGKILHSMHEVLSRKKQ